MKINVTCLNCKRVMRVSDEHMGKKGKCPGCGTLNLIQPQPDPPASSVFDDLDADQLNRESDIPLAVPIPQSPQPTSPESGQPTEPENPFRRASHPPGHPLSSQPGYGTPYQSPNQVDSIHGETDIFGIIGVVLGGLNFLGMCLCLCFGPIALLVFISAIAGTVVSCYGRPPLKTIGLVMNVVALSLCALLLIVGVAFWIFALSL